jgi:hypothetical protein
MLPGLLATDGFANQITTLRPGMRHALQQPLLGLCLPGGHGSGVVHRIDLTRQLVPAALHRD